MAARSVDEVNISNFVDTGLTTAMARYTFSLTIKYTDANGAHQVHGPVTKTFPNDLAAMPLAVRKRFAQDMINATVRVALGIDDWSQYE
jgi:hypothetical protein